MGVAHMRWSVSSWSLHAALGRVRYEPDGDGGVRRADGDPGAAELTLLDLPAAAAERGIGTIELCHFHLPAVDDGYLAELRAAIEGAGVELYSVLIDTGDLTADDPAERAASLDTVRRWVDTAAKLGASGVRAAAGRTKVDADQSVTGLAAAVEHAAGHGLGVWTENWQAYNAAADPLLTILDRVVGLGLCVDFGNADHAGDTAAKCTVLAALMPRATCLHVKARDRHHADSIDEQDLAAALQIAAAAGFDGPASLIADGWADIVRLRERCEGLFSGMAGSPR